MLTAEERVSDEFARSQRNWLLTIRHLCDFRGFCLRAETEIGVQVSKEVAVVKICRRRRCEVRRYRMRASEDWVKRAHREFREKGGSPICASGYINVTL